LLEKYFSRTSVIQVKGKVTTPLTALGGDTGDVATVFVYLYERKLDY